jgi:hypothetical protein
MRANLSNERFFLRLIKAGRLRVTKSGRAFNEDTGKELAKNSAGYRKLSWLDPDTGKIKQVQLHRIVWAAFKGVPDDPELEINHKDGIKQNCRLSNLELATSQQNNLHAKRTGLNQGGFKPGNTLHKKRKVHGNRHTVA